MKWDAWSIVCVIAGALLAVALIAWKILRLLKLGVFIVDNAPKLKDLPYCRWLFNKEYRMRKSGTRLEVVIFVVTRKPARSVLLIKGKGDAWMPPQEGILYGETNGAAAIRGLNEECFIDLEALKAQKIRVDVHDGRQFLGELDLPTDRVGERKMPANEITHEKFPLSQEIDIKRKAYWAVYVVAPMQLTIVPDDNETFDYKWLDFDEASTLIRTSNREGKAKMFQAGLDWAQKKVLV